MSAEPEAAAEVLREDIARYKSEQLASKEPNPTEDTRNAQIKNALAAYEKKAA